MRFWDTSAVVPLCAAQAATTAVRELHGDDPDIVVWWGTRVECSSALRRLARERSLSADEEAHAWQRLVALFTVATEVVPTEEVRARAERVLALHTVRAADALQLGAALVWTRERPTGATFVSLDVRLRDAARREGFNLLPVELPSRS